MTIFDNYGSKDDENNVDEKTSEHIENHSGISNQKKGVYSHYNTQGENEAIGDVEITQSEKDLDFDREHNLDGRSSNSRNHYGDSCHGDLIKTRKMMKNDVSTSPMHLQVAHDNKKRPLSISSTSSSASSTSSLPRPSRHKRQNIMQTTESPLRHDTTNSSLNDTHMDTLTDEELLSEHYEDSFNQTLEGASAASPCPTPPLKNTKELSYIERVVEEIIETEKTYVANLAEIIQVSIYMQMSWPTNKRNNPSTLQPKLAYICTSTLMASLVILARPFII